MFRQLSRTLPALAAALAVGVFGAGSLAVAGGDHRDHRGDHRDHHSRGHDHGWSHHKSCHKRVSGLDERWLKLHIETNLFEIAGGEAAVANATTDEVRALGAELVADHTAALEMATALAERLDVEVPSEPAPLQRWALRATQQFEGIEFDRWFTDLQVEGHKQAILEAETEAAKGCNRKVRHLAAASLPVLVEHLEHAEAILAELED